MSEAVFTAAIVEELRVSAARDVSAAEGSEKRAARWRAMAESKGRLAMLVRDGGLTAKQAAAVLEIARPAKTFPSFAAEDPVEEIAALIQELTGQA